MAEGRKESAVKDNGAGRKDVKRPMHEQSRDNRSGSTSTRGRAARLASRRKAIRRKRIILAFSTVVVLALVVLTIFKLSGGGSTSAGRRTEDIDNTTHIAQALYKVFQSESGNAGFKQVSGAQSKYETTWKEILDSDTEFARTVKANLKDYDYKNYSVSYGDLKGDTFSIVVYPENNVVEIYAGTTTTAKYMVYPEQGTYYDK